MPSAQHLLIDEKVDRRLVKQEVAGSSLAGSILRSSGPNSRCRVTRPGVLVCRRGIHPDPRGASLSRHDHRAGREPADPEKPSRSRNARRLWGRRGGIWAEAPSCRPFSNSRTASSALRSGSQPMTGRARSVVIYWGDFRAYRTEGGGREPRKPEGQRSPGELRPPDARMRLEQGPRAVGILLSGSGSDGTLGLKPVQENGGVTMAQAPVTAEFGDMPWSVELETEGLDFTLEVPGEPVWMEADEARIHQVVEDLLESPRSTPLRATGSASLLGTHVTTALRSPRWRTRGGDAGRPQVGLRAVPRLRRRVAEVAGAGPSVPARPSFEGTNRTPLASPKVRGRRGRRPLAIDRLDLAAGSPDA